MIPKIMKTVYCYLFPEVWEIMKAVERAAPLDMYRLSGREEMVKPHLSKVFEKFPLNTIFKNDATLIDLDNHRKIMSRITDKYSEIIHPLGDFEYMAPGAGSSPLIFHLLTYLKGKGHNAIHVLDGEYEGYGAYASHLGMEVHKYRYLSDFELGDAVWFISNPSTRDGNIVDSMDIKSLCDKGAKVVLDLSYAGSTRPYVYNVEHENIIAVLLSQSKPFGVFRFRMGGFLYTREEIPSLYANKWFKDPLRMLQSLKLLEDLGFHTLYRKYCRVQEKIIEVTNSAYGLHITPSDALLLGYMTPLTADETLSPKDRELVKPYRRGPGWYRFCITPFLEEMMKWR